MIGLDSGLSCYDEHCAKIPMFRLMDKLAWIYLWPVFFLMRILEIRMHLTKHPKRLFIADGVSIRWFIVNLYCTQIPEKPIV